MHACRFLFAINLAFGSFMFSVSVPAGQEVKFQVLVGSTAVFYA